MSFRIRRNQLSPENVFSESDGRPREAVRRLASRTGKTKPRSGKRQPANPAIRAMIGAPTAYTSAPPATIRPIAFALSSKGKCSPTRVNIIGLTIAYPAPLSEKNASNEMKSGARKQPKADTVISETPASSRDLCRVLMLKKPVNNAKVNAAMEYAVLSCPVTATGVLNELPMSIRRRVANTGVGPVAKLAVTNDGKNNLRREVLRLESVSIA